MFTMNTFSPNDSTVATSDLTMSSVPTVAFAKWPITADTTTLDDISHSRDPNEHPREHFPASCYMTLFCVLTLSGVLGIIGNCFIIRLSWTDNSLRNAFGFLLELLCWCGLLMSIFGTPFTASSNYAQVWLFGSSGCSIYAALMTVLGLMQQDTLVLIAVYRYVSLCKPMFKHRLTKTFLEKTSLVLLAESTLWAIAPLLGWGEYLPEGVGTSCGPNWSSNHPSQMSYSLTLTIIHMVVPMSIVSFCYTHILLELYRLRQVRNAPYLEVERKVLPLTIVIAVGFTLAHLPYGFVSVTTLFFGKDVLHPLVTTIPAVIMKMSCFWNSIIYISTDKSYRTAAKRVFKNQVHEVHH